MAGYGPSRAARRPQYDWFFAGDGLIGTDALVATGGYARAREELAFILKYQDRQPGAQKGMIWPELSQSAGYIDGAGKYPYMYVHGHHVQFLPALAHYVEATGDTAFLQDHWTEIDAAFRYCDSVIDPSRICPVFRRRSRAATSRTAWPTT